MRILYLFLAALILTSPAYAQSADERVDQLEQDVLILKRQLDRARMSGSNSSTGPSGDIGGAQTDARITALEEDLRNLRGQIEQKDFETRRVSEEFEKFKRDSEFRFGELEKNAHGAAAIPTTPDSGAVATEPAPSKPMAVEKVPTAAEKAAAKKKMELTVKEVPNGEEAAETEEADVTEDDAPPPPGDTPRDQYNYAFRLLNQNQYDDAAKSFASFTKKYPKDPLVGNAYYWQGETHYIRKDYLKAADSFRQGFEAMPKGPKAADNLLKLGMSLAALKKKDDACVVLNQVMTKYKTSNVNVAAKAQAEHKRLTCE